MAAAVQLSWSSAELIIEMQQKPWFDFPSSNVLLCPDERCQMKSWGQAVYSVLIVVAQPDKRLQAGSFFYVGVV